MTIKRVFLPVALAGLIVCFSACTEAEKKDDAETLSVVSLGEETASEAADPSQAEQEAEEQVWINFPTLDFAMRIPKSLTSKQEDDRHLVFWGESPSLEVEFRLWDQVSDPDALSLAELVRKSAGVDAMVVDCNGRELVKVDWPHGEVNYYLLAPNGDAYCLWIRPYVMKDPQVYVKVKAIEESLRRAPDAAEQQDIVQVTPPSLPKPDYLVLVNKQNPLPEGWEDELDLVFMVNSVGDRVEVERTVYKAYLELKKDLAENEDIDVDLDSAYRSIAYQQDILERFTEKYGAAYAARTVAKPGTSEHHTGLALDLYFRLGDKVVYENEDLVLYPEVWKKIHARLAAHGFILRYPGGKEGTVDYTYEPWHIRYVGLEAAAEISETPGLSFEDWLK